MVIKHDHNMFNFADELAAPADKLPDIELEEPAAGQEIDKNGFYQLLR